MLVKLLELILDFLEGARRFLDLGPVAIQFAIGQLSLKLTQARLLPGDVGFQVFDLAIGETALSLKLARRRSEGRLAWRCHRWALRRRFLLERSHPLVGPVIAVNHLDPALPSPPP